MQTSNVRRANNKTQRNPQYTLSCPACNAAKHQQHLHCQLPNTINSGLLKHNPQTQVGACRYDTVAKLGISSGRQHLQSTFPDGIALDTAFVNPSVVHQLDASAEDAAASGSWCDMQALLPPALTHDDASALLEHCSVMQQSGKL